MTIAWIAPAALAGIALIALPIAIHLLVRQHARTVAYPTLRFLRETQLAAFRRRAIEDVALLVCRIAIIAIAAMALAGPTLQTASRTASYASRISRAVVLLDPAASTAIADNPRAYRSATFTRIAARDAIADAIRWLDQQPASSREVVIAGALRRGAITESELASIPRDVGIRFEPTTLASPSDIAQPMLIRNSGTLMRVERSVHLSVDATTATDGAATAVSTNPIAIIASDGDMPLAEAALNAVLDAGVTAPKQATLIVWAGADESRLRVAADTAVFRMPVPEPRSAAADAVLDALQSASRGEAIEPISISAEQLAAWSRPTGPPSSTAPLNDEGDRRWLWGIVLALLALEQVLRRSRARASAAMETEARVA